MTLRSILLSALGAGLIGTGASADPQADAILIGKIWGSSSDAGSVIVEYQPGGICYGVTRFSNGTQGNFGCTYQTKMFGANRFPLAVTLPGAGTDTVVYRALENGNLYNETRKLMIFRLRPDGTPYVP
jgi:hypothetical protein